jgi:hypothetical protein
VLQRQYTADAAIMPRMMRLTALTAAGARDVSCSSLHGDFRYVWCEFMSLKANQNKLSNAHDGLHSPS